MHKSQGNEEAPIEVDILASTHCSAGVMLARTHVCRLCSRVQCLPSLQLAFVQIMFPPKA